MQSGEALRVWLQSAGFRCRGLGIWGFRALGVWRARASGLRASGLRLRVYKLKGSELS